MKRALDTSEQQKALWKSMNTDKMDTSYSSSEEQSRNIRRKVDILETSAHTHSRAILVEQIKTQHNVRFGGMLTFYPQLFLKEFPLANDSIFSDNPSYLLIIFQLLCPFDLHRFAMLNGIHPMI